MTSPTWRRHTDSVWTGRPDDGPGLLLCHPWWGDNTAVRDWAVAPGLRVQLHTVPDEQATELLRRRLAATVG